MTRIDLTPAEQRQLETTRGSRRSQVAERRHDVLLNAQGWRVPPIGTFCNKGAEVQPALGDPPGPAPTFMALSKQVGPWICSATL
jgi:hypothetical protein